MYVERKTVAITTATGGGATGYTEGRITGRVASVQYIPGAGGDAFASTADFAITAESSGEVVWQESNVTAAKTVRPLRRGASPSGATASTAPFTEGVFISNDRLKFVVAQGGNTKQGSFGVVII